MTPRRKRLFVVLGILGGVAASVSLAVMASRQNIMFYYDPSQVVAGKAPAAKRFRIGGMVVKGSVARKPGDLEVRFVLTDFAHQVPVEYTGVLPDLFREGQGIIAHGTMNAQGAFVADEVLAKHDEKYMPPEVAASLKNKGGQSPAGAVRGACGTDRLGLEENQAMAAELGIFSLILAFVLSLSQAFFGLAGAWRNKPAWMSVARPAVTGQFVFVAMAFACLVYCFVNDDFSVLYVARNSNSHLPLFYKVAALWGAHEGSLLLWIMILSIWSVAVAAFSRHLPVTFSSRVLGVMGLISGGFMLFTLWTSSPFLRLIPAASDGADLNPVLQDFALAIHPPMLYTGYVGFSVAFAFAIAAMLEGRLDQAWAKWTRPWTIFAWLFQTIGIALGSWWAYYELGWGGWWFWDPVENASFMPWLVGTALIHSLSVTEKRGIFKSWTLLLAIFAFSLEPGGNLSGALRSAGLGAFLRDGSHPRSLHPGLPGADHRRLADPVCVACAEAVCAGRLRTVFARVLPAGEQCAAGGGRRPRAVGHAVAAGV